MAIRDTTVKYFASDMPGAIALTGEPGKLVAAIRCRGGFDGSLTLRRLRALRVEAGARFAWTIEPAGPPAPGDGGEPRAGPIRGRTDVGADGLLRIRDVRIPAGGHRLTVEADRGGDR